LLKFVGPVWPILRFHVLHEVDQRRGEGSGARPFPGGEFEHEEGVRIQLDEVAAKDCGDVLDKDRSGAVDPVWCDEDVDAAVAYYSFAKDIS
jgi:hypothetical protein